MSSIRPLGLTKSSRLLSTLTLALAAAACTSSAPVHSGQAGSSGTPGAAGSGSGTAGTGAAGSGSGAAGTTGAAGSGSGTAGTGAAGSGSGAAGTGAAGTTAGTGGAGATAGTSGAAGAGTAGTGGTAYKPFVCPPGPYAAQMMGASKTACVGYTFNYNYVEGPTWVSTQNAFFFSNFVHSNPGGMAGGDIVKVEMDGTCSLWAHDVGTNGLAVTSKGNIVAACHKTRSVTEFDIVTKQPRIVADMYMNKMFDSPNDIVEHSNGTIYFTNPTYELGGRPQGFGPGIFRIDPAGVVTLIAAPGGQPNGIGLSPDQTKLYVVGGGTWNLDADGVPTTKGNGGPGGDGFAVDCAGAISNNGTNSAFGGPDGKTLIVVSGENSVKLVQMTVPGLP